jgi:hypothetical protein
LAVKTIRRDVRREPDAATDRPRLKRATTPREVPSVDAETYADAQLTRRVGCGFILVGFLIGAAGIGIIHASASGYPVFRALDVEIVALIGTGLLLLGMVFGGAMLIDGSRKAHFRPVLTTSLVNGLWIAITLLAVAAIWLNVDKEIRGPFEKVAMMFGFLTLLLVLGMAYEAAGDAWREWSQRRRARRVDGNVRP